eukprot:257240_1
MIASGQYGSSLLKNTAVVNLWDFTKLQLIHSFATLMHKVNKVTFTPDSKFLIAIDLNGFFIVWDTKSFETIFAKQIVIDRQITNIDAIEILNVENDQNQFGRNSKHNIYEILLTYQHNLYKWTLMYSVKHMEYILSSASKFAYPANRTFNRTLTHLTKTQIADSPNNNFMIAATTHIGEIFLFNSKNNVYTDSFQVCTRGANVSCFLNANNIIVGGGDGTVKQFAFDSSTKQWVLMKGTKLDSAVNSLQLSSDQTTMLFVTTTQSNVYKIDLATPSQSFVPQLLVQAPFCTISKIVFGTKYNHIFATLTSESGILTIWDLSNYLSLGQIKTADGSKGTALNSHEEDKMLTGFDNGKIVCNQIDFKTREMTQLWEIRSAHRGKVNCIEIVNELLLSGGDDGLLNIWNYNTKQLISQCHIMIECVMDIIRDPKYKEMIHLLGSNGQIATFSLKREGIIIRRMLKDFNNKTFGKLTCLIQNKQDEFELISSTSNGFILIWDHELTELIECVDGKKIINQQQLQITSCALSNSTKYLCFANNIGQIFIISMATKKLITYHDVHSNGITSIAWTPDDKQIITTSIDPSIAVCNFYT